ncbi:hypothetical protein D3C86_2122230 [compost metagenome]
MSEERSCEHNNRRIDHHIELFGRHNKIADPGDKRIARIRKMNPIRRLIIAGMRQKLAANHSLILDGTAKSVCHAVQTG